MAGTISSRGGPPFGTPPEGPKASERDLARQPGDGVGARQASRRGGRGGAARRAARLVRPRRLRPFPFPSAGARMAAGSSPAAGPRSGAAMAQWRKKKGLRKRRGAAPQSRSSDSEDGDFEIQAEDDTRAQKVSAGLGHALEPEPGICAAPRGLGFPCWGVGTAEGAERSAGRESEQGRRPEHVSRACYVPAPDGCGHRDPEAGAFGPSGPAFGRAPLIGYLLPRGRVLVPFRPMKSAGCEALTL